MPLYEYDCRACGRSFEQLIRGATALACPSCLSSDLERIVSGFAVSSDATRDSALQASRRKSVQSRARRDERHAEVEDTLEHLHDDYGIDAVKPKPEP